MIQTRVLIELAEYRLSEQTDGDSPKCYVLENTLTRQTIGGGPDSEELVSKMTRLANLKRLEVPA